MVKKILVVEDDSGLQKYLKELLVSNDYSVQTVSDGISALNAIGAMPPNLVILDLGLPNMSGEEVCKEIRKKHPDLPVLILTAKDSVSDIVQGLNIGADDYMTKPFAPDVLLARIKARLRHNGIDDGKLKVGNLELDNKSLEVKRDGKPIRLTRQEYKLLEYLMNNKGRVLTREMILNRVWLYSQDIETRAVDVYIGYLRKKIDTGHKKKLIQSIRGFGYVIKE